MCAAHMSPITDFLQAVGCSGVRCSTHTMFHPWGPNSSSSEFSTKRHQHLIDQADLGFLYSEDILSFRQGLNYKRNDYKM